MGLLGFPSFELHGLPIPHNQDSTLQTILDRWASRMHVMFSVRVLMIEHHVAGSPSTIRWALRGPVGRLNSLDPRR